jgi:hypothetical protein
MRVEVEAAVRATLAQAPLSAALEQEGDRFYLVGSDFAIWAAPRQGYVKRLIGEIVSEQNH